MCGHPSRLSRITGCAFPGRCEEWSRIQEQGQGTRDQGTAILMTLSFLLFLLARWRAKPVSRRPDRDDLGGPLKELESILYTPLEVYG
jgi:hypothetical protein